MSAKSRKSIAPNLLRRLKGKQGRRIEARRPCPLFPTNARCKRGALRRNGAMTTSTDNRRIYLVMIKPTPDPAFAATLAKTDADLQKVAATVERIATLHKSAPPPPDALELAKAAVLALTTADRMAFERWLMNECPL